MQSEGGIPGPPCVISVRRTSKLQAAHTESAEGEKDAASTVHLLSALFKVLLWSLAVFAAQLKSNRFSGKSAVVERGKGESVESPDVLEMVTDFLASLRSTLPTNRRKFIHWQINSGPPPSRSRYTTFLASCTALHSFFSLQFTLGAASPYLSGLTQVAPNL